MINELSPYTTPFSTAEEIADTCLKAFHNDNLHRLMLGPRYTVDGTLGRRLRWDYAWRLWLQIRDPTYQWFTMEKDGVVGYCAMQTKRTHAPWLHRLASWVYRKYWQIKRYFLFMHEPYYPGQSPEGAKFLTEGSAATGMEPPLQSEQDLAGMSRKELEDTLYPRQFMVWCTSLAVRPEYHGRGYGRQLLEYALSHADVAEPVFRDGDKHSQGPVKYSLYASPLGRRLYEKVGFAVTKEFVFKHNDAIISSPLMVKVGASPKQDSHR